MHRITKKLIFPLIFTVSLLFVFSLTSCGFFNKKNTEKFTETAFFLDTVVSVTVYTESDAEALGDCLAECAEYEKIFSRTDPESELFALNASGCAEVSEHLLNLIETSLFYCRLSGGRFDVTMGAVSEAYGFSSHAPTLPSAEALAEMLSHTGYEKVSINGNRVTLGDTEAIIDLGAIAKGYIADRLAEMLRARGVESAIIDLGGNIFCLGSKPDGSNFKVGIQYPYRDSNELIASVAISDMSVVTSGVYQRYFEHEGKTYHHILDPETGLSLNNGLISVSIIGPSSTECDALSTTAFSMGLDEGMQLIDSIDGVWAVFITEDMEMHFSTGFAERFGA